MSPFRSAAKPTPSAIPQPATTRPAISLTSSFPQSLDSPIITKVVALAFAAGGLGVVGVAPGLIGWLAPTALRL